MFSIALVTEATFASLLFGSLSVAVILAQALYAIGKGKRKSAAAGRVRAILDPRSRPKWRIFLISKEDAEIIGKRGFILTKPPQSEFSKELGSEYAYAIGKQGYFYAEVPKVSNI